MVEPTTVAFVVVGLALLFFGATFSSWGVSALGLLVGGSAGYVLAPTVAGVVGLAGTAGVAVAVAIGAVIGIVLGYVLLSMAVAAIAFIIGTYVGLAVVAGALVDGGSLVVIPVAIGVGLVLAVLGMLLTKTMMVFLTAFVGAAFASTSVGASDFLAAQAALSLDPILFDLASPVFLGLFVLGVLTQFGLFRFGYVTKLLSILPGVRPLRNRARED